MVQQTFLKLPSLLTDHAVLQHGHSVPIRGSGRARQEVTVRLGEKTGRTEIGENGHWEVRFPAFDPGGPYKLIVTSGEETLEVEDLYFGDVWVCSGQSKMEWPVRKSTVQEELISEADCPRLRYFQVEKAARDRVTDDCQGEWRVCCQEDVAGFSAVALHFGRKLTEHQDLPIGIIQAAWRETQVSSWTPPAALSASIGQEVAPRFSPMIPITRTKTSKPSQFYFDPGNKGVEHGWNDPNFVDADWRLMWLPNYWQHFGLYFNGSMWFRKHLELPHAWQGRDLCLELGRVDDFDVTYFNGEEIGRSEENYYETHTFPRNYIIPGHLISAHKNVIAVRVFDHFGFGGFSGPASDMRIYPQDDPGENISLSGRWHCSVEHMMLPWLIGQPQDAPSSLYNGMIHPLTHHPVRGIVWYQGERDATHAARYRRLFQAMIKGWREQWRLGDVPFLFVQLANYHDSHPEPVDDEWAELREAETAALSLPNTGMAVSLNADEDPMKPVNAKIVAERLVRTALAKVYQKELVYSGPMFDHHRIEHHQIRLFFRHAEGGLQAHGGGELKGFAIAGRDKIFHWADARIENSAEIIVSCKEVPEPVAVRYAWDANPVCNLVNGEDLPASPFRTDHWPGLTEGVV